MIAVLRYDIHVELPDWAVGVWALIMLLFIGILVWNIWAARR